MNDPWQPTPDEVREWANNTTDPWANEPCEDWPLALTWSRHERPYLELASDESCPSRDYMLFILYFVVGHAVRDEFKSTPQPVVEGFIRHGDDFPHQNIREWQHRSRELLNQLETFDYKQWCGGGLVGHAT